MALLYPGTSRLPQELTDEIIDILAAEESLGPLERLGPLRVRVYLRACALVCRRWLHRSRKHLFRRVDLEGITKLRAFKRLLESRPAIGDYVRVLLVEEDWMDQLYEGRVPRRPWIDGNIVMLETKRLPRLEALDIVYAKWGEFSSETEAYFRTQFTSVTSLRLCSCSFSTGVQFRRLLRGFDCLRDLTIDDLGKGQSSTSLTTSSLTSTAQGNAQGKPLALQALEINRVDSWMVSCLFGGPLELQLHVDRLVLGPRLCFGKNEMPYLKKVLNFVGPSVSDLQLGVYEGSVAGLSDSATFEMFAMLQSLRFVIVSAKPYRRSNDSDEDSDDEHTRRTSEDRTNDFSWIPRFLPEVSPSLLQTIEFHFASWDGNYNTTSRQFSCFLNQLATVDRIFAHPRFKQLQSVTFAFEGVDQPVEQEEVEEEKEEEEEEEEEEISVNAPLGSNGLPERGRHIKREEALSRLKRHAPSLDAQGLLRLGGVDADLGLSWHPNPMVDAQYVQECLWRTVALNTE